MQAGSAGPLSLIAGGDIVVAGSSTSRDWPTKDALHAKPAGGPDEVIVAKFRAP